jgi:hypothetical protein
MHSVEYKNLNSTIASLPRFLRHKMIHNVYECSRFHSSKASYGTEPFAIAFVYSKNKGNWIVKGMAQEVEAYIKNNFDAAVWNMTFWKNGKNRSFWDSTHQIYFHQSQENQRIGKDGISYLPQPRTLHIVHIQSKNGRYTKIMTVRRLPHKWIPAYDDAIKE